MQEGIAKQRLGSASREDNLRLPPLGGLMKRALDGIMACIALIALMPLVILTAVIVRLLTEKSIIFSEYLIGHGGRTFVGYRFRIPGAEAENTRNWTKGIAAALSSSRLDKLPLLFNVIRGDMSLIGPRPRTPVEFRDYFPLAPEYLRARPGLSSVWDSGHPLFKHQRTEIAVDRYYVNKWSMALDLSLLKTSLLSGHHDDKWPR